MTPRPHWLLTISLLVVVLCVLMVEAYIDASFTPDGLHEAGNSSRVPERIIDGKPIIDPTGVEPETYGMPAKTIALTFDDGPDPQWTPQVMRVLQKYDARATFFVVGAQVVQNPGLTRQLVGQGHELGIHTFTHPELSAVSQWRRRLEYSQTQIAIAGAAGVNTSLVRYPYSSQPGAVDNDYWPLVQEAGDLGYLTVLTDTDSRDWARPGVDAIVRNATPPGDQGAVVLLHDAGGNRAQTVAALDRLIPRLQARGYRFTTVSAGLSLGLENGSAAQVAGNQKATQDEIWRGRALIGVVEIAGWSLRLLGWLFILAGALTVIRTLLMFGVAVHHKRRRRDHSWGPPVDEPVSVVVPAYNERAGIEAAVRSLAGGNYPEIEVIVVDDGSTDGTAQLVDDLALPNVRVVSVPNSGKPAALNIGVAWARHDLIVMVDGDTVFEPDSIRTLVQPFADPTVGAVAGNVKVGNRRKMVARWQHIEYVIGFNLDRRLYDVLRIMPTVPGAIGAFRRQALVDVGGVSDETLAEDTDLTMALSRSGWRVVYEERARAWTEAPVTLRQLWRQRYRWSYGTMQAMWKHRHAVVEPGPSGHFGRVGLPMLALFQVLLPLLAPLIDILAVYGLFFLNRNETAIAWVVMLGLQLVTAIVAFTMDGERLRPLWALVLQQFVYRQLMYLVLIQSVVTALTGARLRWHKLHRTGGLSMPTATPTVNR